MSHFESLPNDVIEHYICRKLTPKDLANMRAVCCKFNVVASSKKLWWYLYMKDFTSHFLYYPLEHPLDYSQQHGFSYIDIYYKEMWYQEYLIYSKSENGDENII